MFTKSFSTILALLAIPLASRAATFTVTSTNASGAGSLQQAILDANANPGADLINFSITNGGLTISPASPLPILTEAVTIDGSTQSGYSNAPVVEISGAAAGNAANGFLITASNCVIRALAVNRFRGDGYLTGDAIQITNGTGSRVEGCYLGMLRDGVTRAGNAGAGVRIGNPLDFSSTRATNNTVGGSTALARNLISGNAYGIYVINSSDNVILGNTIGADISGTLDAGNTNSGIYIYNSARNVVGGTNSAARNLISGNGEPPYSIGDGILFSGGVSNVVIGNFIGVDASGMFALPNTEHGVNIQYGSDNLIGGADAGAGNLISGNMVNGVNLGGFGEGKDFARTPPPQPEGNSIQGNLIGTDATGHLPIPNWNDGVFIANMSGNLVGGFLPGEGNVINYNTNNGVEMESSGTMNEEIAGNVISGNRNCGVLAGYNVSEIAILTNSIFANTNIGIDLNGDGVTLNDPGDSDTGANNLQNFPVLGFPLRYAAQTVISGNLNSASNGVYHIELFASATNDPSGYGQGQTFLGALTVTNDGGGNSSFVFTNPAALPLSNYITATATDTNGNTSEFSFARRVVQPTSIDLAVTLNSSTNPAPRAVSFFYTLTVTNYGPTNATGVVATDTLPAGLSFVSAVSSQGSCSQSGGVVTCNVGSLAAGAGASINITVNATITGTVTNNASATANEIENNPSNNSASATTLLGVADLAVLTSVAPDPVVAGHAVTFTVIATNQGPDAATGATLTFYVDGGSVVTGASVTQGTVTPPGNFLSCQFGSIPAHGSARLFVTAVPTISGTNNNYANGSALEFDPDNSNNSANQASVVLDGPGVFQFSSSHYTVNEGGGAVLITVMRTGGTTGTASVSFGTSNLTALAGIDYTATNGTLTFLNNESNKTFSVKILDDGTSDCNQSLLLSLFNPTGGAVLIGQTNASLQIFDNHVVPAGIVQGVSLANTNLLTTGNSASQFPSISDDGRYVAFSSYANNLIASPPDLNGANDIFIRDRVAGATTLVSVNYSNTATANNSSGAAKISANGQRVAFVGYGGDLTTNAASGFGQLYSRATASGPVLLVSVNTNGAAANNSVGDFSLSTNGTKIAFASYATDLAGGADNNGNYDVFYRDLASNAVALVSVNASGTGAGNGYSYGPAISADGRYVAFVSFASDLSPADNNSRLDIYRRDVIGGVTALVSVNGSGAAGNSSCAGDIFISGDGRFVAFESYDTDLAPGSTFFTQEIFVRDMVSSNTTLVSLNNSNIAANAACALRGMSRDGRYVLFESSAANLFTNDTNFRADLFLRDTVANVTMLVNINLAGTAPGNDYESAPSLSPDGRYVSFSSAATDLVSNSKRPGVNDVFVRDMQTGITRLLSTRYGTNTGGNDGSYENVVSANGVVAFGSYASDLAQADANSSEDVFARSAGGAVEVVSQGIGLTGDSDTFDSRITGDGSKVAFASNAANLAQNDTNSASDVFLYDLTSHTMSLISVNPANNGSRDGNSDSPRPSADGRFVAYHNTPLVFFNTNFAQIYLRDSVSNTTSLISVSRTNSAPGNGDSVNPQITPDGGFVVFESMASDLASNDVNGATSDVFIRNRTNTLAELVSVNAAGTASANSDSRAPSVSADGRFVAFETFASNLGPADSNNHFDVYVRDRLTGSNILCSPNLAGNNGGNNDSFGAVLSASGNKVIFFSYASDLVAGDTNSSGDLFAFDVASRTVQLVSRNTNGVPGNGSSFQPSVSADGRYVVFYSEDEDLVPNDANMTGDVFVRDLIAGTTRLVSVNCQGTASGNYLSDLPQISADGRFVTFHSYATDLAPGDFTLDAGSIFRRDLQAGTTVLASQNRALTGEGDAGSTSPKISDNGGAISFLSAADNLIFGDANNVNDAYAWSASIAGVDLGLTKTASTGSITQGGAFSYILTVTNYGLASASGVVVTDALPATVTFISATSSQGTCSNNSGLVNCNIGSLNSGSGASITINVTAPNVGNVTNSAIASSTQTDSNPGNNAATAIVTVTPPPAPRLSLTITNGSQLFFSWPYPSPGYALETTTNLVPVTIWSAVTNSVSNNGVINYLLLNRNPAERQRFFRLRHP